MLTDYFFFIILHFTRMFASYKVIMKEILQDCFLGKISQYMITQNSAVSLIFCASPKQKEHIVMERILF